MKIDAIIQVRSNSSRLKNKCYKFFHHKTYLEILISRVKKSKYIDNIIIATTNKKEDDRVEIISKRNGLKCIRGSENNVFKRFNLYISSYRKKYFLRITGDRIFFDWKLNDFLIKKFYNKNFDYVNFTNSIYPGQPNDFTGELINSQKFRKALNFKLSKEMKEHIYPYFLNKKSRLLELPKTHILFNSLTLDTKEDLNLFRELKFKFKKITNIETKKIIQFFIEKFFLQQKHSKMKLHNKIKNLVLKKTSN